MLHENHREQRGVFGPEELALFNRVLKTLESDYLDKASRSSMAQRVMANYMAGIRDETELVEASRQPLGR